ncbi:MAG: hypothetical protein EOM80_02950 [Erysipelotrichia bacterium]|nr:hypothetical protein [Erysipelotrichia bacterium]
MKTIGFDFGSVYTKGILIDNGKTSNLFFYHKKGADDMQVIKDFLAQIDKKFPNEKFKTGITGIPKSAAAEENIVGVNAIIATATGSKTLGFSGRSIIEIGGQNAKLIELDLQNDGNICEFTMNDACAAGSGMFIEQQAKRLQMSLEEFSNLSANAEKHVAIAGRCAVFAKSDMIHLQQKGSQVVELTYGLCKAICRNFQAMLLKGRELEPPVMIAGGCAKNGGIIRAFNEIFSTQNSENLFVSPLPGLEGAIGAAIKAEQESSEDFSVKMILQKLEKIAGHSRKETGILAPLAHRSENKSMPEPGHIFKTPQEGYLGVDVGSVSTDMAVIDTEGKVISSVYLPTRGRPVEALSEGLSILKQRFGEGLKVLGCGTTGSGRHLAGKILGADIVKNEITCQFLGVQHYISDVDTIFEIGGQDSKYISVRNACIADFVMNKVCAAGTGSFLEEQAHELGISIINEFSQSAFKAERPVDLGSHCTVFMETEVVNSMQKGVSTSDICAGLAYSIVRNYLEKVVGNKPIGRHIAFQGGVASNQAVVAAFEQTLKQPVSVIPYNRISGAIGAAIAAKNHASEQPSTFRGLDCSANITLKNFHCHLCSNNCEVSLIEQGGEKIYYGDTCERYTSSGGSTPAECRIPNLANEYNAACEAYFGASTQQGLKIGIPRASTIMGYRPFWGTFFRELGCIPVLSGETSETTLALGLKNLPASVCLPVKLTAGHVTELHSMDLDYVFIPSIMHLPGNDLEHSYACPYAMAMPFMINRRSTTKVLSPVISMIDEDSFVEGFVACLSDLNTTSAEVRAAYRSASRAQKEFHEKFQKRAAELIAGGEYSYAFSIIGKPYNVFDAWLNLGLFERLRRLKILAIPLEILPVNSSGIECMLPWGLSSEIFKGAAASAATDNIFPLLISNYGCALDAFTFRQLEEPLRHKPHLIVEFDEHRGEVGLITRLEAFIDQLESVKQLRIEIKERPTLTSAAMVPDIQDKICMPYWSDYVYAYAGIWEHRGYKVEILPMPDQNIRILGEKYSLGKECSPYAMVVGDLLQLHRKNPEQQMVYHFPSVTFPCLLCQYGNSIQILIRDLGIKNIRLSSLNGTDLTRAFGVSAMQNLYEGLLAIDVLVKAACATRPYEKECGMTGNIHHQNLTRIREGIAAGNVMTALNESLQALATVPVERNHRRPIVGIAGDLYTKVNEVANNNLFLWLESQGLEVWPSPSQIDLLDCGITSSFLQSLEKFELGGIIGTGAVALRAMVGAWRVRNTVGNRVEHLREPGYLEMLKLAGPYMNNNYYELLLVNIAKIVDFIEHGADGVINAICFNCMVGNASAAIIEKIRRDYHTTPIITAVYSGSENQGRQMQLDAFTCQVKEHFRNRN